MAGQQFQYDDSGNTFFYFLTSFVGLIVIPATYYLWPRDQNAGESRRPLPADPRRPHQRPQALWRPAPAQPSASGVTRTVRPGLCPASATGGARVGGVSLRASPPPFIVLRSFARSIFSIVVDAPCSLLLPLCLLCLCFYWGFFFMEEARWDGEDGDLGGEQRVGQGRN